MILKKALIWAAVCAVLGSVCAGISDAAAQLPQVNRSHSFGPDQCGPGDPSYIRTANETGGVPLFLQRNEAGKAMQLMLESTRENVSTVLWASSKLAGSTQTFDVPVDSVTERITFTFSVDNKGTKLILRQANGQEIGAGSPGVTDTELNCGRVITMVKPQAGTWHVEVKGSGTFWLEAQAQSEIYFIKAEFVELAGRPGHQGLFRIQGQPITGQPATLQVSISAAHAMSAEAVLVSSKGELLQKLHLKTTDNDHESLELTGDLTLPAVPFRIAVMGRDAKGMPYQRYDSPLFHAESVQVIPKFSFDEIVPGTVRTGDLEVKNFGPARNFKVSAVDAHKLVRKVEPAELFVGSQGIGRAQIQLDVPAGKQTDIGDDVVILVSSMSEPPTTNSAIVHLSISGKTDPVTHR